MPYIRRDKDGMITALSQGQSGDTQEWVEPGTPELEQFLGQIAGGGSISATDQDFVRVLEDLVELLVSKGVILFTELPESAQQKVMLRQQLRSELSNRLDLLGDD